MVFLCWVEFLGRQNLSYYLPVQNLLLTLQRLLCCILLLRCVEVYTRSVLCPHIIPLAIKRSWIMPGPEHVKQSIEAALLRVILNPNDLRMVRGPRTHILIGGIVKEPLGVPDLSLCHARGSLKRELHAPETTRSELCELLTRGGNVVVWTLSNRRVGCGLLGPWGTKAQFVQEVHGGGERLGESFQGSESVKVFSGFGETVEERFGE